MRIATLSLGYLLTACSGSSGSPEVPVDAGRQPLALYFPPPGNSWETVEPSAAGWDPVRLNEILDFVGQRASRAFVVLWNGRLMAERYWQADATYVRDIASAQKSVVAVIAGLARQRELVTLEDKVTDRLGAGWSNAGQAEARIDLRHLLTQTSGLDDLLNLEAEPGTKWRYTNHAYHQVRRMLESAAGRGIEAMSYEWLWTPIGVTSARWYARPGMADPKGKALWGLTISARDMARFGLLIQAGGLWKDRPVVSDTPYLEAALKPSQALNPSYGYLWWLNGQGSHVLPPSRPRTGPLLPSAPLDLVAALGKDDQKIYVSRSLGLVVTRLGAAAAPTADALSDFDDELWARLQAARSP